jgi:hypothetical protein
LTGTGRECDEALGEETRGIASARSVEAECAGKSPPPVGAAGAYARRAFNRARVECAKHSASGPTAAADRAARTRGPRVPEVRAA